MNNKTAEQPRCPPLWVLVIMASIGPFGDTEYIPSLPAIQYFFGSTYNLAQLTLTTYLIGFALFQLVYGLFSDKFGRRPLMLFGAVTFLLGSIGCAMSSSMLALLLMRFVQGLGSCAGSVLSNASIRDAVPPESRGRIYAIVNIFFAVSPGVAPIVGVIMEQYFSWHANFILLSLMAFLLLIIVFFFYNETNYHKQRDALTWARIKSSYSVLIKDPYYTYYVVVMGLMIGVVYSCLSEAPSLVIMQFEGQPIAVSLVALGVMFGFMLGSYICSKLAKKVQPHKLIATGLVLVLALSLIMLVVAHSNYAGFYTMLPPIIFCFTGIALVLPISMSLALAPFENNTGVASSVLGFSQMSLASLGTLLISWFHDGKPTAMPYTFIILSSLALLIFVFFVVMRPGQARCCQ